MIDLIILAAFIVAAAFLIHKTGKDSKLTTVAGYIVAGVMYLLTAGQELLIRLAEMF